MTGKQLQRRKQAIYRRLRLDVEDAISCEDTIGARVILDVFNTILSEDEPSDEVVSHLMWVNGIFRLMYRNHW